MATMQSSDQDDDPFDSLLSLEDQFYAEGYAQGEADGLRQARLEGRIFGFEQAFTKYLDMGKLRAQALIWQARLKIKPVDSSDVSSADSNRDSSTLASFPKHTNHDRLAKHIEVLLALVDSQTLSTENTDEASKAFEDRLKRAQAKVKVVERMIGKGKIEETSKTAQANPRPVNGGDIEAFGGG